MTLTKWDLAQALVDEIGLNGREAKEFVDLFFEEINAQLEQGDPVKLSGFGNFTLRDKKQRLGRNPKTGESFTISRRRVAVFHAGPKLRSIVTPQMDHHHELYQQSVSDGPLNSSSTLRWELNLGMLANPSHWTD